MGISSSGIGSNLDIDGIITKLMEVEKRPLTLLSNKETSYKTKLTAYSMVQSSLSQFQSAMKGLSSLGKYTSVNGSVANKDVANVTVGSGAANGSYSLEVRQLAQNQKLVAAGQASDKATIGGGKITFEFGTVSGGTYDEVTGKYTGASFVSNGQGSKTVTIDPATSSLSDIRDAINRADMGVSASIVNVGGSDPYRLVLTSKETGEAQSMKISVTGDAGLSDLLSNDPAGTQNLQQTAAAKNAEFTLDGISFSKPKNTVTDAMDGITLNLLSTNAGKPTTVSVTRDTSAAITAVKDFVKAYNDVNASLKQLTAYDSEKKEASVLTGDSAVRSIETQLRRVLGTAVPGGTTGYSVLSDIGVNLDKYGTLKVDDAKLQKALEKDFNALTRMFAEGGSSSTNSVQYVSASSTTKPGTYNVHISQAATQGFSTLKIDDLNLTGKNTTMMLEIDGASTSITLEAKNYGSAQELANELESKINTAGSASGTKSTVTVNPDGTLKVMSNTYGSASKLKVTDTGGTFTTQNSTEGKDVAGTINGLAAVGSGQYLSGAVGSDAAGLKLQVTGENANYDATVNFAQGYAFMFDKAAEDMLKDDGVIKNRIDGMNTSLQGVAKDQTRMQQRLATVEARYRRQFTALDTLLASLNQRSEYLSQQLEALKGTTSSSKK